MPSRLTREERKHLLDLDYITLKQFASIIGRDTRTVKREIEKKPDIHYVKGWGYLTEDLIRAFRLKHS